MDGICLSEVTIDPAESGDPVRVRARATFTYDEPRQVADGRVLIRAVVNQVEVRGWVPLVSTAPVEQDTIANALIAALPAVGETTYGGSYTTAFEKVGQTLEAWGEGDDAELLSGVRARLIRGIARVMLPVVVQVIAKCGNGETSEVESFLPALRAFSAVPCEEVLPGPPGKLVAALGDWAKDRETGSEFDAEDLQAGFQVELDLLAVPGDDAAFDADGMSITYEAWPPRRAEGIYTWPPPGGGLPSGDISLANNPASMSVSPADTVVRTAGSHEGLNAGPLPVVTTYQLPPGGDALYLDRTPGPDDIRQGGLGDCFFLSLLSSIASHDPDQISHMITVNDSDNDRLMVRFWRRITYPDQSAVDCPQLINVTPALPVINAAPPGAQQAPAPLQLAPPGRKAPGVLYGARLRAAPAAVQWKLRQRPGEEAQPYVQAETSTPTALWAPLVEKAFAVFVACYGLTTPDPGDAEPDQTMPDYATVGGGIHQTHPLYRVIYGPRLRTNAGISLGKAAAGIWGSRPRPVIDADIEDPAVLIPPSSLDDDDAPVAAVTDDSQPPVPGADTVPEAGPGPIAPPDQNRADQLRSARDLVSVLLMLQAQRAGQRGSLVLCIAAAFRERIAHRLVKLLPRLHPEPELVATVTDLTQLALDAEQRPIVLDQEWSAAAGRLFDALAPARAVGTDPALAALADRVSQLLLILLHRRNAQIYLQAPHDYALVDATLVFAGGQPPGPSNVTDDDLSRIDDHNSRVSLRNPHHGDSPAFPAAPPAPDNGAFTMTLRDFLAGFTNLDYAEISRGNG